MVTQESVVCVIERNQNDLEIMNGFSMYLKEKYY